MSTHGSTKINQKEYLKKYLSGDTTKKKKKKDKKHKRKEVFKVKIIDDDAHVSTDLGIDEELLLTGDDAPQIVGTYIEEHPTDGSLTTKWKSIVIKDEEDDYVDVKPKITPECDLWGPKTSEKLCIKDEFSPPREREKHTPDMSPQRKDVSSPRNGSGYRQKEKLRRVHSQSRERKNKLELCETRKKSPCVDQSPPRRKKRHSIDNSPPRRRKNIVDQSPPRRRGKDSSYQSPQRRGRQHSFDQSPPREKRKHSADQSPPRRRRSASKSPKIKREKISPDLSPVRKRNSSPRPPTKNKSKSPVRGRQSRWDDSRETSRSVSPPATHKPKVMLDGKRAGLQDSQTLKIENMEHRRREDQMFAQMPTKLSGRDAEVQVRSNGRRGRRAKEAQELNPEEQRRKDEHEKKKKELYDRWGKGLKQVEAHRAKVDEEQYESSKPLARYSNDEDLEKHLRDQERADDPMLEYMRQKNKEKQKHAKIPAMPIYQGSFPENRFGIRPGYRWDGVDRSSGYEKKWFDLQNEKKAVQDEAYKYSVEDM